MASIRTHRNRLLIDFRENGQRVRHYTKLEDTSSNRALLERVAQAVQSALDRSQPVHDVLQAAGLVKTGVTSLQESVQPIELVTTASRPPVLDMTPTFAEFVEQWFIEFSVGWRKTYVKTVRGIIDKYLTPRFGSNTVGSIRRAQILDFRAAIVQLRGRRPGTNLSPARVNTVLLILRQILMEASDRYEFPLATGKIKPLKIPKSDVKPFSLSEVIGICDAVRKDYRPYMQVRFFTGMRSGEIHGLKWKYVDFERRLILVREAFIDGEDEYTKTDASQRDIVMNEVVYQALKEQQKRTGRREYVFINQRGEPLDTANVTKRVWYPLLRYLRLEPRRPYQTRHTCASLWLASGETPEWCARQLGHASTEMLFKVYSRFVPNLTRADGSAANRLIAQAFGLSPLSKDSATTNTHPRSEDGPGGEGVT